jgi:hypothetical protein
MAKFKVIVAMFVFLGVLILGTGLIAQQYTGGGVAPKNQAVRALVEARLGAAKEIFEAAMAPPHNVSLDDMPVWSRRWMDEQMLLDSAPIKRLSAIQNHLDRLRTLEEFADRRFQEARGTHADVLKVKYFRLEAEQMLAEIRIINPGLFPPKAAPKP